MQTKFIGHDDCHCFSWPKTNTNILVVFCCETIQSGLMTQKMSATIFEFD